MPKPKPDLVHPVQQRLFNYLLDNALTYKNGAKVFGFGTPQSMHMWLFKDHKREPTKAKSIEAKLDELEDLEDFV